MERGFCHPTLVEDIPAAPILIGQNRGRTGGGGGAVCVFSATLLPSRHLTSFSFPDRYTLTEGDFHHLKNARLSHLPLPPAAALKIVTIHECASNENSIAMTPRRPPAKPSLAIFQVSPPCPES